MAISNRPRTVSKLALPALGRLKRAAPWVRHALLGSGRGHWRGAGGLVIALAGALAFQPGEALGDIQSFTDSAGVVHFSTRPKTKARDHRRSGASAVSLSSSVAHDRVDRYGDWIRQASALYQIPEALIRAVIQCESNYDPRVVSPTGAQGLMQLMPETALRMQVRDSFDPRENIFGGTRYLRVLANLFNGDIVLTIAGYNAGEGAIVRYAGVPPYAETQTYVERVLSAYRSYRTDPSLASAY